MPVAESVIKRRLKTLRQIEVEKDERAAQKTRRLEERAAANGIDVELQALVDRPCRSFERTQPLSFYYGEGSAPGRDAAFMRRRAVFYSLCAMVFGFQGWNLRVYEREIYLADQIAGGRDGRALDLMPIDQSQAVNLNTNAAPLEWLVAKNWLETKKDPSGYGSLRWAAALRFRDDVAGSQSGGLKAQAYEGAGGGFGPRLVSDYALDCMASVTAVRARLHPGLYRLLQMAVVDDIWIWEVDARRIDKRIYKRGQPAKARDRRKLEKYRRRLLRLRQEKIILKLHKAIDGAAVVYEYMTEAEYRERWFKR